MLEGKIIYYNSEQRFGLIKRADGERDIRFLFDALMKAGVTSATAGQIVKFELVVDPASKKVTAGKLQFTQAAHTPEHTSSLPRKKKDTQ